ncbi:unnamed protein product [Calypogeia fissa]
MGHVSFLYVVVLKGTVDRERQTIAAVFVYVYREAGGFRTLVRRRGEERRGVERKTNEYSKEARLLLVYFIQYWGPGLASQKESIAEEEKRKEDGRGRRRRRARRRKRRSLGPGAEGEEGLMLAGWGGPPIVYGGGRKLRQEEADR